MARGGKDILLRAFDDTIIDFGPSIREAVKADLNSRLCGSNGKVIDLLTISECLQRFFGQGSTELIMSRIFARADELFSEGVAIMSGIEPLCVAPSYKH